MSNVVSHAIPDSHFIGELGLTHWVDQGVSYGKADITSEMLVPGTSFVRIGIFGDVRRPRGGSAAVRCHESDH